MNNFLMDKVFLSKLNKHHVKEYYALVSLLDFNTEAVLKSFESRVVSGNISIAANSSVRRTGSLSLLFDRDTYNIMEISNLISLDKKVSISIGVLNPFFTDGGNNYAEKLWFPQGVYFITSSSLNVSQQGCSISINIIDKMGKLNGTCGGVLPASVSFHEIYTTDENENTTVSYPLIRDIIYEAVQHFGGENPSKIVIEDVPLQGRKIVKYIGQSLFCIAKPTEEAEVKGRNFKLTSSKPEGTNYDVYHSDDLIGYMSTDLTFPGELVKEAGATVTEVLDEIVKALGNFEYFYDVNGDFHFRKIKNFLQTGVTPLNLTPDDDGGLQSLYLPYYTDYQFLNEFQDASLITSISYSPNYQNIKNDFICWGSKSAKAQNSSYFIRYHLAIDERPFDIPKTENESNCSLCHQYIYMKKDNETKEIIGYEAFLKKQDSFPEDGYSYSLYCSPLKFGQDGASSEYDFNWREELYRMALIAYGSSTKGSDYDEELMAEWRNLYDPENADFEHKWNNKYGTNSWYGYNPLILQSPMTVRYWLDIIDSPSNIGRYSVKKIGKRSKAIKNTQINQLFSLVVPDIVFIKNPRDKTELQRIIQEYISQGQEFSIIDENTLQNFTFVDSFGTCFEEIQSMLLNNLVYNCSINLSSIPIFYLDVNNVVRLNLKDYGIFGDYAINSINFSFGQQNNAMSLQLNEALVIA